MGIIRRSLTALAATLLLYSSQYAKAQELPTPIPISQITNPYPTPYMALPVKISKGYVNFEKIKVEFNQETPYLELNIYEQPNTKSEIKEKIPLVHPKKESLGSLTELKGYWSSTLVFDHTSNLFTSWSFSMPRTSSWAIILDNGTEKRIKSYSEHKSRTKTLESAALNDDLLIALKDRPIEDSNTPFVSSPNNYFPASMDSSNLPVYIFQGKLSLNKELNIIGEMNDTTNSEYTRVINFNEKNNKNLCILFYSNNKTSLEELLNLNQDTTLVIVANSPLMEHELITPKIHLLATEWAVAYDRDGKRRVISSAAQEKRSGLEQAAMFVDPSLARRIGPLTQY